MKCNTFQSLVQRFFLERLMQQQKVSPCTIETYRDAFRLLLKYMHDECGMKASSINVEDIHADRIIGFLNDLENNRKNKSKTVNNRLAVMKAFMDYVAYECPEYLGIVRKIKAIPFRRVEKKDICYLNQEEIDALLQSCETTTPEGRRDYLMVLLLYNTGLRISELITLQGEDIILSGSRHGHLRVLGKGRKERTVPLWQTTMKYLDAYIQENRIQSSDYLMSGRNVRHLTRSGARYRLDCIVQRAKTRCPSLIHKSISPHVFRHSTAMSLLQTGVDISTIAIWLGHESIETTHQYMVADIQLKEKALEKLHLPDPDRTDQRYRAEEGILQFLNSL